ncbi:MAG TPA: hypothetical protein VIX12_01805 [Candidatus Binataceae bacterium]
MKKTTLFLAVTAIMLSTSMDHALAHDMSSMDARSSDSPNAMGAHMKMDAHMTMTPVRPVRPDDIERANDIVARLRRVLARYRDYHVALAQGFRIFLPTIPQDVYHFTDYQAANEEYRAHFSVERPGSLLYVKKGTSDYVLVGAMYSAPPDSTPEQLDALIPLSVGRWHAHVNVCLPQGITLMDLLHGEIGASNLDTPGTLPIAANPEALNMNHRVGFMADGRFGFLGTISDEASCKAAGGHLVKQAFGWMIHVYPLSGDDLKVAYGLSVPDPSR